MDGYRCNETGETDLTLSRDEASTILSYLSILEEVMVMDCHDKKVMVNAVHCLERLGVERCG